MTPRVFVSMAAVLAATFLAACGGAPEPAPQAEMDRPGASAEVAIAFRSEPSPPRAGDNAFEVTVRDAGGQPVTDAQVSVEFFMPAMPEMEMPEMRHTATLQHDAGGVYRGRGQVMMAGDWEVTVTATRDGEPIGHHTLSLTAQP